MEAGFEPKPSTARPAGDLVRPRTASVPVTRTPRPSRRSAGQGSAHSAPDLRPAEGWGVGGLAKPPGAAAPLRNQCYCKMAFPPTLLRASARVPSLHLKARRSGQAPSQGFPPRPRARGRLSLPLRRMGFRAGLRAAAPPPCPQVRPRPPPPGRDTLTPAPPRPRPAGSFTCGRGPARGG